MIVSLAGSRGVGKSSVLKKLKIQYPDCIVREGFRNLHNGLDCNKYDEFIKNEKQYITREIQDYKQYLSDNRIVFLTRGLEEVLAYMDFFVETNHPDWKKEDIYSDLGIEYKLLTLCKSDLIIYLDASDEVIITRLKDDMEKKRDKVQMWLSFNKYTHELFSEHENCYFINVNNLSIDETAVAVNTIISKFGRRTKLTTEISILKQTVIKKTNDFYKCERLLHTYDYQKKLSLIFPEKIPEPIKFSMNNTQFIFEETRINGERWNPTEAGAETVIEELALFLNKFYRPIKQTIKWRQFLFNCLEEYLSKIKSNNLLNDEVVQSINTDFSINQKIFPDSCSSIIHGDLIKDNIIVNKKNGLFHFTGLVDFEWSQIGDPVYDIAKLNFIFMRNENLKNVFYKSLRIKKSEKLIDLYFTLILLKQISMHKELLSKSLWDDYIKENIQIINSKYQVRRDV